MAFDMYMLLLFCLVLGATAGGGEEGEGEGEGDGEGGLRRPRSVVVVVAPLGKRDQRLLDAVMPTCQRIATCNKDVYPWWKRSRRECDCLSALDHTLRQLARWGRETHGMPTGVVTALNPTNATDEPIVLTMSLPDKNPSAELHQSDADLIKSESNFLSTLGAARKYQQNPPTKNVEDDIDNELTLNQDDSDIAEGPERKLFGNKEPHVLITFPGNNEISLTTEGYKPETSKLPIFDSSSQKMNKISVEEKVTEEGISHSESDKKHQHGDHTHHDKKFQCSSGKGGGDGKCASGMKASKGCDAMKGAGCHRRAEGEKPNVTLTVADFEDLYDLRGLQITSRELQHLMFKQWIQSLDPTLAIVSRFRPVGLPLELPLRLTAGLPRELMESRPPPMHVQSHNVPARPTESALLAATRKALDKLEAATGHDHASLLIVRSLAPLHGAELYILLDKLGVPVSLEDLQLVSEDASALASQLSITEPQVMQVADEMGGDWSGGGGFSSPEQRLAGERLVVVVNGCPAVFDRGLELFAQGPRAEDLQPSTSLEDLNKAIQSILKSTNNPHEGGQGGVEELTAVELPRAMENFPRVRLHVTRVRSTPCAGRFCVQPALELCRHPYQRNCRRQRRVALMQDTTESANKDDSSSKRKRYIPNSIWSVLSELQHEEQGQRVPPRDRKSADANKKEEVNGNERGDEKTKSEKKSLLMKNSDEDPSELTISPKKKRQIVEDQKKESNEDPSKELSKVERVTKDPEEHPFEEKEEERKEITDFPSFPSDERKKKEIDATKQPNYHLEVETDVGTDGEEGMKMEINKETDENKGMKMEINKETDKNKGIKMEINNETDGNEGMKGKKRDISNEGIMVSTTNPDSSASNLSEGVPSDLERTMESTSPGGNDDTTGSEKEVIAGDKKSMMYTEDSPSKNLESWNDPNEGESAGEASRSCVAQLAAFAFSVLLLALAR